MHPTTDILDAYDALGRLASVTAVILDGSAPAAPQTTTYAYDLADELVATTQPNGTVEYRTYDTLGRLNRVETVNAASGTVLAGYALDGRRRSVADDAGRHLSAGFDAQGRVVLALSGTPGRTVAYI